MFTEERNNNLFSWKHLGNVIAGRPTLGPLCSITTYRLLQYTIRDELIRQFSVEKAREIIYNAGVLAGREFCKHILDSRLEFNAFIELLQTRLKELHIGIMQVEEADLENMQFTLTVSEDLDCSGLPPTDETVCDYDEGFIAGILNHYTKKKFEVKEIDCWASGKQTCRFRAKIIS